MGREKRSIPLRDEQMIDSLPSPGYRFVPTDQELIKYYLRPRVANRNLPRWNVVRERDVYGEEEPAEIFGGESVNEMYFFTPIKSKYRKDKKIDRVIAGKGAWKAQGMASKEIYDESAKSGKKLVGFKRTLSFVSKARKGKGCSWIIHEYILNDDVQNLALCRIKRGTGNTTSGGGGGIGVSPLRFSMSEDRVDEEDEDEDIKIAATKALYEMAVEAKLKKTSGEIQPVDVQQMSDRTGNDDSNFNKAFDSDDGYQPEVDAPIPKHKGNVVDDDSDSEPKYVGSPIRYKKRTNNIVKNSLAIKCSNDSNTKPDPSKDNSGFVGPSRTREFLSPISVGQPNFNSVDVDYNRDIVSKGDSTFKSSKVPLPHIQNDAHNVKVLSPPEELLQAIIDSNNKIQLAGIAFSSKYRSLAKQYMNLKDYNAKLESELDNMKKELADRDSVFLEKDWENKTLHDVLKNEKASNKRKLENMQKMVNNLKVESTLVKMKNKLTDKDSGILENDWENQTLYDVLRSEKASYKRKLVGMQANCVKNG